MWEATNFWGQACLEILDLDVFPHMFIWVTLVCETNSGDSSLENVQQSLVNNVKHLNFQNICPVVKKRHLYLVLLALICSLYNGKLYFSL